MTLSTLQGTTMLFPVSISLYILAIFISLFSLWSPRRFFRRVSLSLSLFASLLLLIFSCFVLLTETAMAYSFFQLLSFVSLEFYFDNLAAFFLLTISLISSAVLIYTFGYIEHYHSEKKKNIHICFMLLFLVSMIFVVAAKNTLVFLFFWELMSLASFFLVCFEYEKKENKIAGAFYLIMAQLSTMFLVLAFFMIHTVQNSFEITSLPAISAPLLSIIFLCLFFGFGIKAGIIPFHKWLPYAHPAAPSNISALMSGLIIKVAIYGIIRFLISVLPSPHLWWGVVLLIAGTLSAILGVIYALKEHDIKQLLAYHSIENIGIILMAIGLFVIFTYYNLFALAAISMAAALFHTLNHGLFKSLLFLTAGSVVEATHTKNIEEMGGLIKRMPITAALFLLGSIAISALPPLNGFVSEFLLFFSLFQAHQILNPFVQILFLLCLALLALTSALAAACFVKAFSIIFLAAPRSKHAAQAVEVNSAMLLGPSLLALLCIVLGVFSFQIFSFIGTRMGYSFPLPDLAPLTLIAAFFLVLTFIVLYFVASRKSRISETWGCGLHSQNSKMEYTASGFSEPIVTIFSFIYQPKKKNEREFFDSKNILFKSGKAELTLIQFFEKYLYSPVTQSVQKISQWLYKIQNEVALDSYILYEFIAILVLLIIVGVAL